MLKQFLKKLMCRIDMSETESGAREQEATGNNSNADESRESDLMETSGDENVDHEDLLARADEMLDSPSTRRLLKEKSKKRKKKSNKKSAVGIRIVSGW
jgi:hypothetical protein